ncbi:MAG: hypothetical protein ACKOC5_20035 [Chloroflexota bacterium]
MSLLTSRAALGRLAWLVGLALPAGCRGAVTPLPGAVPGTPAPVSGAPASSAPASPAVEAQMPPIRPITPAPGPGGEQVWGGIELQNGACCIGGVAGETSTLVVSLAALSSGGAVNEMRLLQGGGACPSVEQLSGAPWQPYRERFTLALRIETINWVGAYFGVQFRDAQGNLSAVYCDEISVEGMPPPPTPAGSLGLPQEP